MTWLSNQSLLRLLRATPNNIPVTGLAAIEKLKNREAVALATASL